MRVSRVAALVVCVTAAAGGQSPIVPGGTSVRLGAVGLLTAKSLCQGRDAVLNSRPWCGLGSTLVAAGAAAGAPPAAPQDPPLTSAAFARYRRGDRLRIWMDTTRVVGAFIGVDEQFLRLRSLPPIALGSIDVVETRINNTAKAALGGGLVFGLFAFGVNGLLCGLDGGDGGCIDYRIVGVSAGTGLVIGGFLGSLSGSWRTDLSRRR